MLRRAHCFLFSLHFARYRLSPCKLARTKLNIIWSMDLPALYRPKFIEMRLSGRLDDHRVRKREREREKEKERLSKTKKMTKFIRFLAQTGCADSSFHEYMKWALSGIFFHTNSQFSTHLIPRRRTGGA